MKIIYLEQKAIDQFNKLLSSLNENLFYVSQLEIIILIEKYEKNAELISQLRIILTEIAHNRFSNASERLTTLLTFLKLHREGWISILNSRKYHYCINGQTICNKFLYFGNDYQTPTNTFTKNDCSKCIKVLQKMK